jgi:tRNA modification GTPase
VLGTLTDTICAPITGPVAAAVAVIRVSGPDAWRVTSRVLTSSGSLPSPRMATFFHFQTGDEGILTLFEEGKSFTGDQTAEIGIHGSLASVRAMLDLLVQSGARMAQPGEFTYRAFMNGKLSLSEAEGIRVTVDAQTASQLRLGNSLRGGDLDAQLGILDVEILKSLATVEAYTDFS